MFYISLILIMSLGWTMLWSLRIQPNIVLIGRWAVNPGDDTYIKSALKSDGTALEHSLKHVFPLKLFITHLHQSSEPLEELSDSENISGIPADAVVGTSGSMLICRSCRTPKRVSDRNEDYL